MSAQDVQNLARISRELPQPANETEEADLRADPYGNQYANCFFGSTKHALADEGSYYVVTNPTIGTGVAHALVTAFSDTAALFAIYNAESKPVSAGGKNVYLDYLRLMLTAAPTATVSMEFAAKLDDKDRTPTANNVAVVPVNVNGSSPRSSNVIVQAFNAGSLTVPTSGPNAKTVARARIATGLGIVGDEYVLQFGGHGMDPYMGLTAARATVPGRLTTHAPPIIIGPRQWCVIHRWWLTEATGAPSFEYEIGLAVR